MNEKGEKMATPKNIKVKTSQNYLPLLNKEDDFQVRFLDMTDTVVTQDGMWEEHRQVTYEIILIYRGKYRCSLDGSEISMKPWDLLIIQPGQKHEDYLYKGCTMYGFHFHLISGSGEDTEPVIFSPEIKPHQQVIHLEDKAFFLFLIRNLVSQTRNQKNQFEYFYLHNAIFNVIFRKILLLYPAHVLFEEISEQLTADFETTKLYTVFSRHLDDMPDLDELCQECGMSRSSLHRLCHTLFKLPPRKAFMHYKMTQIQNFILKNPGMRVKEVSSMFGFKNPFHFSRIFRQEMGIYPNLLAKCKDRRTLKKRRTQSDSRNE